MPVAPEPGEPERFDLTVLLNEMQRGDLKAAEKAVALVYRELHSIAARELRSERPGHLLQTTALVHEAYARFAEVQSFEFASRVHFFSIASQQMRRILVDYARARNTQKRGGGAVTVGLDGVQVGFHPRGIDLLSLDEALRELNEIDLRAAKVVELRYFGGYTDQEVVEALGVSLATVRRDWEFARSWLFDRMQSERRDPPATLRS